MFDGYLLCTTPRSGSTLLCGLLKAAGAGAPNSFYHRSEFVAEWTADWGIQGPDAIGRDAFDRAYLAAAIRAGQGGTPLFGMRQMRDWLGTLTAALDRLHPGLASDRARLERAFGRLLFVHLTRGDKLGQAISLVRAEQSGLWHRAPDGSELERLAPPQEPAYDFARLAGAKAHLEAEEADWQSWFAAEGIAPLRLTYEALATDPAAELARVLEALGLPAPRPQEVTPGVAKLADALSREWARRFREDAARS